MNLMEDAWIPVIRKSKRLDSIAPWQLTTEAEQDPCVELAPPRPDFRGALIQFLIGLMQSALPPVDARTWKKQFDHPPTPEQLKAHLDPLAPFFNLDGEGPRFMQDLTLREQETRPVEQLLSGFPGDNTLKQNTDHFIKRNTVDTLCPYCVAMAVFTFQTNGLPGGPGYRVGIRGGGPLTTLALGNTLWQTVWLNVLEEGHFLSLCGNPEHTQANDRFPWLAPTRTSEKNTGIETQPSHTHPLHVYWGMPQRIRLNFEVNQGGVSCDLCGIQANTVIHGFQRKNYGFNYTGPWRHPLTPYYKDEKKGFLPVHVHPDGVAWHHWMGVILPEDAKKRPADVVQHLTNSPMRKRRANERIWAFGYDAKSYTARCWYDGTLPLILAEEDIRETMHGVLMCWVQGARWVAAQCLKRLKEAWFSRPGDARGDFSFVGMRFWQETEAPFFERVAQLEEALKEAQDDLALTQAWHGDMRRVCHTLFDDLAQSACFDSINPRRVATAWHRLQKDLNGNQIRKILDLPLPAKPKRPSKKETGHA